MNRFLSQHKRNFPSPRLEILLRQMGTRLVSSDMLQHEFSQGRMPLYVLDKLMMTPGEKDFLIDPEIKTLWVTQQICDEPIQHEMFSIHIGTERTGFKVWTEESRKRPVRVMDSIDVEMKHILESLLNVATATNVTQRELMILADCLFLSRLSGNQDEYYFTKLANFDQGIICIEPQDIITCAGLRKYIRTRRSELQNLMIETTVRVCNRLFKDLNKHPEFHQYREVIEQKIREWRTL